MGGIQNDSFLKLDQNISIELELFLYGNGVGTQGDVKLNATASVLDLTSYRHNNYSSIFIEPNIRVESHTRAKFYD